MFCKWQLLSWNKRSKMAFGCATLVMVMTPPPPSFMGNITLFVGALLSVCSLELDLDCGSSLWASVGIWFRFGFKQRSFGKMLNCCQTYSEIQLTNCPSMPDFFFFFELSSLTWNLLCVNLTSWERTFASEKSPRYSLPGPCRWSLVC